MFSWSECWSNPSNQKEIGRRLCWKTWGWWYGWRRRRRWITNMIQSEEIRSISRRACSGSISTITRPPLIWLWFMFQQHTDSRGGKKIFGTCLSRNNGAQCAQLHLTDLSLDNSRRLLVCCAVCPCCLKSLTSARLVAGAWADSPCWLWLTSLH